MNEHIICFQQHIYFIAKQTVQYSNYWLAGMASSKLIFAVMLILGMCASEATARTLPDASMVERHETWMIKYGRTYKDETEKAKRFEIFKKNVEYINSVNQDGSRSYKLAENHFADLTNEEFQASRNGYKMSSHPKSSSVSSFRYANVTAVPSSLDWRTKGAVTAVKDQGQCGKRCKLKEILFFRINLKTSTI